MKIQRTAYPLRLDDALRDEVAKLAFSQDRSLNWQLSNLIKLGLESLAEKQKSLDMLGGIEALNQQPTGKSNHVEY